MLLGDELAQLLLLILRQLSLLLLELSFNRAEPVSQILAHRLEPNTFGRVLLSKCDPIDIAERLCLRHCQRQHLLKALQILLPESHSRLAFAVVRTAGFGGLLAALGQDGFPLALPAADRLL